MKKHLLAAAGLCLLAAAATAQTVKKVDAYYYAMSPDARYWLCEQENVVYIFDQKDSTTYEYGDAAVSYSIGQGNMATNSGIVVGGAGMPDMMSGSSCPAYWQNGKWEYLPMGNYPTDLMSKADGITPDGNVIVGSLMANPFGDATSQSVYAAIWTKDANGQWKDPELLPQPQKDFSGRDPQYIQARFISDDGKVIAGQIRSWDGFVCYPIVWKLGDDGQWTYSTPGLELAFDTSVELPKYPEVQPRMPEVANYQTQEDVDAYKQAMQAYNDSIDLYYSGLIDDWPRTWPMIENYISDPENKAAYDLAMKEYQEANMLYQDSLQAFNDVYYTALTDVDYVFNNVYLTTDGKKYVSTLDAPDPNADPMDMWAPRANIPMMIDLETGQITQTNCNTMVASSVTDNGDIFCVSPAMAYSRNSYIVPAGTTEPVAIEKWLEEKSPKAAEWIVNNSLYDGFTYGFDDEGNFMETEYTDSLITGSMVATPDGRKLLSYNYDEFAEGEAYSTYFIDLDGECNTGIATVRRGETDVDFSLKGGNLNVNGNVQSVTVTDPAGRTVYTSSSNFSNIQLNKGGVYIVKVSTAQGTVAKKVVAAK